MQFLNIINKILAPNKHNINFGSLNMTVQRMPNILQYVLQYAVAVSYRIAIRLQPQYPPLPTWSTQHFWYRLGCDLLSVLLRYAPFHARTGAHGYYTGTLGTRISNVGMRIFNQI